MVPGPVFRLVVVVAVVVAAVAVAAEGQSVVRVRGTGVDNGVTSGGCHPNP